MIVVLLTCIFARFSIADDKLKAMEAIAQAGAYEAAVPPPEMETLAARRNRLVDNIDLSNNSQCSRTYLETARKALARTFAIFCAKIERRPLGKISRKYTIRTLLWIQIQIPRNSLL